MNDSVLSVRHLTVALSEDSQKKIIDDVSFDVPALSIVAIVGGSGSGKSTTAYSILKLLSPALQITAGEILFKGRDILEQSQASLRQWRGKDIGMIFQEPLHAFNPVFTVGDQIAEVLRQHAAGVPVMPKMKDLLIQVGLTDTERVVRSYPHQLSGGMRQRAMIAQAVAASPSLLIADEPTSSLDVTLQAKVLELFRRLRDQFKLSMILITHDLGVVEHIADQVVVLERGRVVESGPTRDVISRPKHSYTQKLMQAQNI